MGWKQRLTPSIADPNGPGGVLVEIPTEVTGELTDGLHGNRTGGTLHALATSVANGFLPAADKASIDANLGKRILFQVRNETGLSIPAFTNVSTLGKDPITGRILVQAADRNDPARRPAFGVTLAAIANNANGEVLYAGLLTGVDTSAFSESDQLVLGASGAFSRPPPDQDPFPGEVQNLGQVLHVHAAEGVIQYLAEGLNAVTADQLFALEFGVPVGWKTGGVLTREGGLDLGVTAGESFIVTGGKIKRVLWSAATLTLTANAEFVTYVDSDGNVSFATTTPDLTSNIVLGSGRTDGTEIVFLAPHNVQMDRVNERSHTYADEVVGPVTVVGGLVTINGFDALGLDVDSAIFYIHNVRKLAGANAGITFTYWRRDAGGNPVFIKNQTQVDPENYDDGSGALVAVPALRHKKDLLFVAKTDVGEDYHLVYGQETWLTQSEAEAGNNPVVHDLLRTLSLRLAGVVSKQGTAAIVSVVDQRPFVGQLSTGSTAIPTDHGFLSGLSDNDHPIYQLRSEEDQPNGYAGLSAIGKLSGAQQTYGTSANTATEGNDARVPTQSENDALAGTDGAPSGTNKYVTNSDARNADARTPTGAAGGDLDGTYPSPTIAALAVTDTKVAAANKDGIAATPSMRTLGAGATQACAGNDARLSDARTPLVHAPSHAKNGSDPLATSTAVEITDSTNAEGVNNDFARSNHQHAHGSRGGGLLHALASAIAAGFMSAAHFSKLDTLKAVKLHSIAELSADASTSSTGFIDLLTLTPTTGANDLLILFSAAGALDTPGNLLFRLLIDGIAQRGTAMRTSSAGASTFAGLILRRSVTAGAHTVKIQWKVSTSTGRINPVSAPDSDHATLIIAEIEA